MPQRVWIALLSLDRGDSPTVAERLSITAKRIDGLAASDPDIICLPENFATGGVSVSPAEDLAQPQDGPIAACIAAKARELGTNIICPLRLADAGRIYNTALVFDRSGEIAGRYDKIHPTDGEIAGGITPGARPPRTIDLDIGRIGIQTCFDLYWPDGWQSLGEQGAEIVFWPSAHPGGKYLNAYALLNRYYVVGVCGRPRGSIIDITGVTIAAQGIWEPWLVSCVDLERQLFCWTEDHWRKMHEMRAHYGRRLALDVQHDEDTFALHSNDDRLTVKDIVRDFGLVTWEDYFDLQNKRRDEAASTE